MRFRELLAVFLPALLVLAPGAATGGSQFHTKLNKDQQILHALDRLTFGPRPGDIERVRSLGLKKWIDRQLHPESIPENPALAAKLAPFDSVRMSPEELTRRYPQQDVIKAIAEGRQPLPSDPLMRASVSRMVARFEARQGGVSDEPPASTKIGQILNPEQIAILRKGTPDQKRELLNSLSASQFDGLAIALPQPMLRQLNAIAPPEMRRKIMLLNTPQQVVPYDLINAKLLRAIYSNRQLAEELDDFWFNHFNIFYNKGADRFLTPEYEREAIRPHVLGHFRDLLEATAKSPAMLVYLDNFQSVRPDLDARAPARRVKRGLNENYGRELMELHTLGVNGGYTQKDVIEVARCFTGWTVRQPQKGGGFFYNDKVHDKGQKIVLGHVIPAGGGMDDGEKVLDILASHPSTAHHISLELAQRFVADDPPQSLVDRMAKTFLSTHGDIREVMKTMLKSKEFWSQGAYRAKVKTPFEMVAGAVRALDANVDDAQALSNRLNQLGEPLYRKLEPTGYSNLNSDWVNSAALLGRMNFALALAGNKLAGIHVGTAKFENDDPSRVATALLGGDLSPQTRAAISRVITSRRLVPGLVAGLVLGSPDFQKR